MRRYILHSIFILSLVVIFSSKVHAEQKEIPDSYLSVLGGYGVTHKGLGKTKQEVHVLDLIFQYDRVLLKDVGSSWYRGHHSLVLELPLTLVLDPDVNGMVGVNVIGAWTFDS